jgi:acetyltransferase-like isoleucine patch superfamily enzyme
VNLITPDRLKKVPWKLRYEVGGKLATQLRKMEVLATHRHARVQFNGPVRLGPGFALVIPDHGSFIVGTGVDFRRGFVCEISGEGVVTVGDGVIFTSVALLQCTSSITIKPRATLGQSTLLVDGIHEFGDPDRHLLDQGYDYRPLTIGMNAIIMTKSTVFADVGDNTIVGAHSVVSRPLPERCLAVGAPAKPVRYFTNENEPAGVVEG